MQIQTPNDPGALEPMGSAPPVRVDGPDHVRDHDLEPIREEALLLLRPNRERAVTVCMVASALLAGITLNPAVSCTKDKDISEAQVKKEKEKEKQTFPLNCPACGMG